MTDHPDEITWIAGKPYAIEDRGMSESIGTRRDGSTFVLRYSVGMLKPMGDKAHAPRRQD
jgi:hypothetical protein